MSSEIKKKKKWEEALVRQLAAKALALQARVLSPDLNQNKPREAVQIYNPSTRAGTSLTLLDEFQSSERTCLRKEK